jgi:hypothetical protein
LQEPLVGVLVSKKATPDKEPINPDIKWYKSISESKNLPPRCPFADADKCKCYDESFAVINCPPAKLSQKPADLSSTKFWKSPTVSHQDEKLAEYKNLCPEIAYESLGFFARNFNYYMDERDKEHRAMYLERESIPKGHWLHSCTSLEPLHYSDCRLFSTLKADHIPQQKIENKTNENTAKPEANEKEFIPSKNDIKKLKDRIRKNNFINNRRSLHKWLNYRIDQAVNSGNISYTKGKKNIYILKTPGALIDHVDNLELNDMIALESKLKKELKEASSEKYLYAKSEGNTQKLIIRI